MWNKDVHFAHCYQGDYDWGFPNSCKYGDKDCPAKGTNKDFEDKDSSYAISRMWDYYHESRHDEYDVSKELCTHEDCGSINKYMKSNLAHNGLSRVCQVIETKHTTCHEYACECWCHEE